MQVAAHIPWSRLSRASFVYEGAGGGERRFTRLNRRSIVAQDSASPAWHAPVKTFSAERLVVCRPARSQLLTGLTTLHRSLPACLAELCRELRFPALRSRRRRGAAREDEREPSPSAESRRGHFTAPVVIPEMK